MIQYVTSKSPILVDDSLIPSGTIFVLDTDANMMFTSINGETLSVRGDYAHIPGIFHDAQAGHPLMQKPELGSFVLIVAKDLQSETHGYNEYTASTLDAAWEVGMTFNPHTRLNRYGVGIDDFIKRVRNVAKGE